MGEKLDRLKDQAPASGSGGEAPVGERLMKLQQSAGALANATETMIKAMEGNTVSF